jgi:CubicO group peptidase (beta-lactamase class C family)
MNSVRDNAAAARIDEYLRFFVDTCRCPSVALAITGPVEVLHACYYGKADVGVARDVTADTPFYVASVGKAFTAAALLKLAEDGLVRLDDPVRTCLPWFEVGGGAHGFEDITLHHLMTHTAGIPSGSDFTPASPYEVYALREVKRRFAPGATFHYSNVGYKALGHAIEHVTGLPYPDFVEKCLLDPLGMTESYGAVTHSIRHRMAVGYVPRFDDRPYYVGSPLDPAPSLELGTGDGSIVATVEDLCKFLRMLLNAGDSPAGRVLSRESVAMMCAPAVKYAFRNDSLAYGYGITIEHAADSVRWSHGGEAPGFKAYYVVDPARGLAVAAASNGPFPVFPAAYFALNCYGCERDGLELPAVPAFDATRFDEPAAVEGQYACGDRRFDLERKGEQVFFSHDGVETPLRGRGPKCALVEHPDFSRFLLETAADGSGAFWHGGDLWTKEAPGRVSSTPAANLPQWRAFPGHYRSHNPWLSNFRIVARADRLVFVEPSNETYSLVPTEDPLLFHLAAGDAQLPEWIEFSAPVEGVSLRVSYSGGDYYRFFTE